MRMPADILFLWGIRTPPTGRGLGNPHRNGLQEARTR